MATINKTSMLVHVPLAFGPSDPLIQREAAKKVPRDADISKYEVHASPKPNAWSVTVHWTQPDRLRLARAL